MKYLLDTEWRPVSGLIYSDTWILKHRFEQNALQMNHPLLFKHIGNNREKKQAWIKNHFPIILGCVSFTVICLNPIYEIMWLFFGFFAWMIEN